MNKQDASALRIVVPTTSFLLRRVLFIGGLRFGIGEAGSRKQVHYTTRICAMIPAPRRFVYQAEVLIFGLSEWLIHLRMFPEFSAT